MVVIHVYVSPTKNRYKIATTYFFLYSSNKDPRESVESQELYTGLLLSTVCKITMWYLVWHMWNKSNNKLYIISDTLE